jgi:hypothetical protein
LAIVLLACLHWPQAQVLVRFDGEIADWTLRSKGTPLPALDIALLLAAALITELIPYIYEL